MTEKVAFAKSFSIQTSFEMFLELLPDAVVIVDDKGCISKVNGQTEKMFGYNRNELPGIPVEVLVPDHLREGHIEQRVRYHSEPRVRPMGIGMELSGRRKDGTEFPVEISLSPVGMENAISVISIVRDISERKRAEELLRTRARQQAVIVELGQLALAGRDLDSLVNDAALRVAVTLGVEYCKVLELLPESCTLLLRGGVGWREGSIGHLTVSASDDSEAGYILISKEPVVVEDLETETRFSCPRLLHEHRIVSGVNVIIPGQKQPFGVMGAHATK